MTNKEIISRLNSALGQMDAVYNAWAKKNGLTYNSLMAVYIICGSETVTQKMICDILYLSKSTVHSILVSFIEQGYVVLESDIGIKEKRIVVTDKGKAYFGTVLKGVESIESSALSALGKENAILLTKTAEAFGANMEKALQMFLKGGSDERGH